MSKLDLSKWETWRKLLADTPNHPIPIPTTPTSYHCRKCDQYTTNVIGGFYYGHNGNPYRPKVVVVLCDHCGHRFVSKI